MLAPGGEVETRDAWSDLALESLRLYPDFVAELESASGIVIDYRRSGAVDVAFDEAEWQSLMRRAEAQLPLGIPSICLSAADVRARIPLFDREIAGALFYPEDAIVDPRDVMRALRIACCVQRVEIREGFRVERIDSRGDAVEVDGEHQTLHASVAVLAAGAWSSEIQVSGNGAPESRPQSFPVKGHLIGYQLEADSLGPILRSGHTYLLQRSGGFTIAGTSSENVGFDRNVDEHVIRDITARAGGLFPYLSQRSHTTAWNGFRPGIDAAGPEMRRLAGNNIWLAYGHYRNGILLAPVTANLISRQILSSSRCLDSHQI
jgi:glycine oxidase